MVYTLGLLSQQLAHSVSQPCSQQMMTITTQDYTEIFHNGVEIYRDLNGLTCVYKCLKSSAAIMAVFYAEERVCSCMRRTVCDAGEYVMPLSDIGNIPVLGVALNRDTGKKIRTHGMLCKVIITLFNYSK